MHQQNTCLLPTMYVNMCMCVWMVCWHSRCALSRAHTSRRNGSKQQAQLDNLLRRALKFKKQRTRWRWRWRAAKCLWARPERSMCEDWMRESKRSSAHTKSRNKNNTTTLCGPPLALVLVATVRLSGEMDGLVVVLVLVLVRRVWCGVWLAFCWC